MVFVMMSSLLDVFKPEDLEIQAALAVRVSQLSESGKEQEAAEMRKAPSGACFHHFSSFRARFSIDFPPCFSIDFRVFPTFFPPFRGFRMDVTARARWRRP